MTEEEFVDGMRRWQVSPDDIPAVEYLGITINEYALHINGSRPFRTIAIDPPWFERGGGQIKRGADRHYPIVKTGELPGLIQSCQWFNPAPDCHLYLWATNNHLPDALWLVEELGFAYVTLRTWAKTRIGLGQYYRGQTEHLIFARSKVTQPALVRTVSTLVGGKPIARGRHSAKPVEAYQEIERVSNGPRLEMFAREPREGWFVWGNEV